LEVGEDDLARKAFTKKSDTRKQTDLKYASETLPVYISKKSSKSRPIGQKFAYSGLNYQFTSRNKAKTSKV
jgi:hypothetical protein